MALIICPECGKQVSDQSDQCVYCGYPIKQNTNCTINGIKFDLGFLLDDKIEYGTKCRMSDIAINNIISTLSKFNFIDNWNLVPNVSLKPHEDIKEKDEKFNVNNVIKEIKGKSPDEIKKCIWSFLWKKVPCLTAMFIIGTLFLAGVAVYTGVKQIADVCKSCYEKIIVNKEGKEDTYIVNTESAKLYYEPSSHAAVVILQETQLNREQYSVGGEIPPMNNKKKGFYYMGKIYFIADTKIGEESMTTAPLYVITDDNNNRLFTDILEITDVKAFEKHPDREKFITTVFQMVENYFSDIGKIGCTVISAVDKNTHIFQWGIRIERTDDEHISTSLIDWKATEKKISHYKQYKVTNNVTNEAYTQWIEGFVRTVIQDADIECKELVIDDIEESKRIFLLIDGKEYTIRTWSYRPYRTAWQLCIQI